MQERLLLARAPVASVERLRADEIERAGDIAAVAAGHDQQDPVGHALADQREEAPVEIRPAPFPRAGVHVEGEEGIPGRFRQAWPGEEVDLDAAGEGVAALPADRLPLARGEGVEEIVEIAVAFVDEMELLVGALEKPGFAEQRPFRFLGEGHVHRRGAALGGKGHGSAGECELAAIFIGARPDEEPSAGRRCEGHRHLQLRIVAAAGTLERLGPAVVEDVFAHRVGLEVAGKDRIRFAVGTVENEVLGEPAGLPSDRAGFLERPQKIVRDEGVIRGIRLHAGHAVFVAIAGAGGNAARCRRIGAGVPVCREDLAERTDNPQCRLRLGIRHGRARFRSGSPQGRLPTARLKRLSHDFQSLAKPAATHRDITRAMVSGKAIPDRNPRRSSGRRNERRPPAPRGSARSR